MNIAINILALLNILLLFVIARIYWKNRERKPQPKIFAEDFNKVKFNDDGTEAYLIFDDGTKDVYKMAEAWEWDTREFLRNEKQ